MNRSLLRGATFGLVLAISCFLMVSYLNQEKIVVVDSQKVLQGYQGFMEAQDLFESKMEELKEDFNNKRQVYQQKNKEYEILENQLSSSRDRKAVRHSCLPSGSFDRPLRNLGSPDNTSSGETRQNLRVLVN